MALRNKSVAESEPYVKLVPASRLTGFFDGPKNNSQIQPKIEYMDRKLAYKVHF